jgi:hypothetical protein
MRNLHRVALAATFIVLVSCTKKTDPSSAPAAAALAAPPAAPIASAPPLAGASAASPLGINLAQRLQREAQSRPHIAPNADDVLAAFGKVEAAVPAKKQGLGATYKASFCEGGTTGDGSVTVSVCEYADHDAAQEGLATLEIIFPAKQAQHVLHKDTVLTTLRLQDTATAQALENRLVTAYQAL